MSSEATIVISNLVLVRSFESENSRFEISLPGNSSNALFRHEFAEVKQI